MIRSRVRLWLIVGTAAILTSCAESTGELTDANKTSLTLSLKTILHVLDGWPASQKAAAFRRINALTWEQYAELQASLLNRQEVTVDGIAVGKSYANFQRDLPAIRALGALFGTVGAARRAVADTVLVPTVASVRSAWSEVLGLKEPQPPISMGLAGRFDYTFVPSANPCTPTPALRATMTAFMLNSHELAAGLSNYAKKVAAANELGIPNDVWHVERYERWAGDQEVPRDLKDVSLILQGHTDYLWPKKAVLSAGSYFEPPNIYRHSRYEGLPHTTIAEQLRANFCTVFPESSTLSSGEEPPADHFL